MVKSPFRGTVGMTCKTFTRRVSVTLNTLMLLICRGLVVLMAAYTCKHGVIARDLVTGSAIVIPFVFVFSTVDREILPVVIESCRSPTSGSVTILTRLWELSPHVIRVLRVLIIGQMTAFTLIWSVSPSRGMAVSTPGGGVLPGQWEIHDRVIKRCRYPAHIGVAV